MHSNNSKDVSRRFAARFLALNLVCASAMADALLDEPLALSERAPLAQRFNLPAMRGGELLAPDRAQWRLGIDVANNFVRERNKTENLFLDGESQRYELGARYGIGKQWEVGIALPWISYNGGTLDNFIEGWHSAWGLPDGDRPDYPARKLRFSYQRNGRSELDFHSAASGIGDVQLQLANQLLRTERDSIALIATLNLPTGDDDDLLGSGGTGGGILLAATRRDWLDLPLHVTANVGVQTLPGDADLSDRQKDEVWLGGVEIAWAVAPNWRLRAQLNAHSALYESGLTPLGDASTQLLLGGSVRLAREWALDVAIGEDIAVDTAPDVTLQLALKTRF